MEARVAADPGFRVVSRAAVLVGDYDVEFDVRPDGGGFIFSEAAQTASSEGSASDGPSAPDQPPSRLVVVVSWFDELSRRMGSSGYRPR